MNHKKRQREAALYRRFTQAYPVPEGPVEHEDRPDFRILTAIQGVLGVEVTELYQQPGETGPQAQEVERLELLDAGQQRCTAAEIPPVDVAVSFAPYVPLGKANRAALAAKMASLIEARMPPANDGSVRLENNWRDPAIPECVLSIRITRFPWREEHRLTAPEAGWVQMDCVDLIQSRLDAKEPEYVEYRKACDECWLLIAASGWRPSSLFSPSRDTLQHQYKTMFQKVFFMEHFSGSLNELKKVP